MLEGDDRPKFEMPDESDSFLTVDCYQELLTDCGLMFKMFIMCLTFIMGNMLL